METAQTAHEAALAALSQEHDMILRQTKQQYEQASETKCDQTVAQYDATMSALRKQMAAQHDQERIAWGESCRQLQDEVAQYKTQTVRQQAELEERQTHIETLCGGIEQAKKELEDQQKRHNETLDVLRIQHAREKQASLDEAQKVLEAEQQRLAADWKQKMTELERHLGERYTIELANISTTSQAVLKGRETELMESLQSARSELSQLQNTCQKLTEQATAERAAASQREAEHKRQLQELESSSQRRWEDTMRNEAHTMRMAHDQSMLSLRSQLQEAHEKTMKAAQEQTAASLEEYRQSVALAKQDAEQLRQTHAKATKDWEKQLAEARLLTEQLQQQTLLNQQQVLSCQQKCEQLEHNLQASQSLATQREGELNRLQGELEKISKQFAVDINQSVTLARQEAEQQRQTHARETKDWECKLDDARSLTTQLQEVQQRLEEVARQAAVDINEARQAAESETSARLEQRHGTDMQQAARQFDERLNETLKSMELQHSKQIQELKACLLGDAAELKTRHQTEMSAQLQEVDDLKNALDAQKDKLEACRKRELDVSEQLVAAHKQLSERMSDLEQERRTHEEKLRQVQTSLESDHSRHVERIQAQHLEESRAMLTEFDQAQQYLKGQISGLTEKLKEADVRYINREPRDVDVQKIAELEEEVRRKQTRIARLNDELAHYRLEIQSREDSLNRMFNVRPNVGVLNPTVSLQKKGNSVGRSVPNVLPPLNPISGGGSRTDIKKGTTSMSSSALASSSTSSINRPQSARRPGSGK
ncbi:hypothetical protein RI367_000285 [Sorochytrium milnesiophthora]